jgi:hypothetical protein
MANISDYFENTEYAAVLPLADRKDDKRRIIGSATMVIPGLFITSRHLIQQYMKDHDSLDYDDAMWAQKQDIDSTYNLELLHILKGRQPLVWSVQKIHPMHQSDIAILTATRLNDEEMIMEKINMRVRIDLHLPKIGAIVISLGYPESNNVGSDEVGFAAIDESGLTTHKIQLRKCEGPVEDIETTVTQRSPRFQTSLAVDGGMSGGPVFNASGELTGINATGFTPNEHNNQYTSFAIPLFTAFNTPLSISTENDSLTKMTLYQLAKEGYLDVKGLAHFRGDVGAEVWDTKTISCADCP